MFAVLCLFFSRVARQKGMAWYVVFRDRIPGVYRDWPSCNDQVCGFLGCSFRSYPSQEQALTAYLAYFGKADPTAPDASGFHGAALGTQVFPVAAETDVQGPATLEATAGEADVPAGPPAAAEQDMAIVLVLIFAMLLVITAYLMN